MALFATFGLQKDDMVIIEVFQKSEILKNAVSERWCTDSGTSSSASGSQHLVNCSVLVVNL